MVLRALGVLMVVLAGITGGALAQEGVTDGHGDDVVAGPSSWTFDAAIESSGEYGFMGSRIAADGDKVAFTMPTNPPSLEVHQRQADGTWMRVLRTSMDEGVEPPPGTTGFSWSGHPSDIDLEGNRVLFGQQLAVEGGLGLAYVVTFGPGEYASATLDAPDRTSAMRFGAAVDLDGPTAVVGAPGDTEVGQELAGRVFVFTEAAGNWTIDAVLEPDSPYPSVLFGHDVELDGEWLAVAAADDGPGLPDGRYTQGHGAVYLFRRGADGAWVQTQRLMAPDSHYGGDFGADIALRDGKLLVGGMDEATEPVAYLAELSGPEWKVTERWSLAMPSGVDRQKAPQVALDDGLAVMAFVNQPEGSLTVQGGSVFTYRLGPGGWSRTDDFAMAPRYDHAVGSDIALGGDALWVTDADAFDYSGPLVAYRFVPAGTSLPCAGCPGPGEPALPVEEVLVNTTAVAEDAIVTVLAPLGVDVEVEVATRVDPADLPEPVPALEDAVVYVQVDANGTSWNQTASVNLTLEYGPGVAAEVAANLTIHYWDGAGWVDLEAALGDGGAVEGRGEADLTVFATGHDPGTRRVWATVNHTSTYALAPAEPSAAGPPGGGFDFAPLWIALGILAAIGLVVWAANAVLWQRQREAGPGTRRDAGTPRRR